jgi:hypothetical protein
VVRVEGSGSDEEGNVAREGRMNDLRAKGLEIGG